MKTVVERNPDSSISVTFPNGTVLKATTPKQAARLHSAWYRKSLTEGFKLVGMIEWVGFTLEQLKA